MLYGRIFAIVGLIILLANAANYLSNVDWNVPSSGAGLVMIIAGGILIKKGKI
jgi:hypothetical protein